MPPPTAPATSGSAMPKSLCRTGVTVRCKCPTRLCGPARQVSCSRVCPLLCQGNGEAVEWGGEGPGTALGVRLQNALEASAPLGGGGTTQAGVGLEGLVGPFPFYDSMNVAPPPGRCELQPRASLSLGVHL